MNIQNDPVSWDVVLSAASAIFTALAATGVFLAARQLKFDAWLRTQELWTNREVRDLRSWLLSAPDRKAAASDKTRAKDLCRKLDEFARLVPYLSWFPRFGTWYALRIWGNPLAELWTSLKDVVNDERLTPKTHMHREQIRKGLPPPCRFGLRDLRFCT